MLQHAKTAAPRRSARADADGAIQRAISRCWSSRVGRKPLRLASGGGPYALVDIAARQRFKLGGSSASWRWTSGHCRSRRMPYMRRQRTDGDTMAASFSGQDRQDHFAYCVQLFGGTTAASRRLGIDERAIRRFINGERPLGNRLLEDTAKALRLLVAEATAAEEHIAATLRSEPNDP